MNPVSPLDQLIGSWLRDTAPAAPPPDLHSEVLHRVRRSRQRNRGWLPIGLWTRPHAPTLRAFAIALSLIVLGSAAFVWSGLPVLGPTIPSASPIPSPARSLDTTAPPTPQATGGVRGNASTFKVPFSYLIPSDSPLVPSRGQPRSDMMAWIDGRDVPPNWQAADEDTAATVTITAPLLPWLYSCGARPSDRRTALSLSPREFLADLHGIGGLNVIGASQTMLGGIPALVADVTAAGSCSTVLMLSGSMQGLVGGSPYARLAPSHLIVAERDGQLILADVSAPTSARLEAFLPIATQLVESIRFTGDGATASPPMNPMSGEARSSVFAPAFSYAIPLGSGLQLAALGPQSDQIAWVIGENRLSDSGGQETQAGNISGIIVAAPSDPWSHTCPGAERSAIGQSPGQFLADLRDVAGVGISTSGAQTSTWFQTSLDGLPALGEDALVSECAYDLHIRGPMTGIAGSGMLMVPSRLIVAQRGDSLIVINVWAHTRDDLLGFLPSAYEFVNSIHFTQ